MLFRFDDQQTGAFGENEPVAAEIERPAGSLWIVIPLGERAHVCHGGDRRSPQAGLGAPGDDEIRFVPLNHLRRLDEGLDARGAGCRRGDGRAVDAERHRDLAARHVGSEEGDGQGMHPFGALRDHCLDIGFHDGNAAAAAVDNRADTLAVIGIDGVAGVLQRFGRGGNRKVREAVHPLRQLGVHELFRIEVADFAANADLEIGNIEVFYLGDARLAGEQPCPERGGSDAEWGNSSCAGHDHSLHV
jgi:hypothetical protein